MPVLQTLAKPASATTGTPPGREALVQRKCACGGVAGLTGECQECDKKKLLGTRGVGARLQTKLAIGEPGDEYEQEADRIAEQVANGHGWHNGYADIAQILNIEAPAATTATTSDVPPLVSEVLNSPGQPLDHGTRSFFEPRFGYDFSGVRVHADGKAAESAKAINALGYTVAPHIVLSRDRHSHASQAGRRLIAHELTHIVQQSQTKSPAFASAAPFPVQFGAGREPLRDPRGGTLGKQTHFPILQRSTDPPAPEAPARRAPTDEELLQLLERFPAGEPKILYHVDEKGGVLASIQEKGRNFPLNTAGEFNLTSNVEVRTGFKGGAGLNNIIRFYLDSRFVALLQELALSQASAGALEGLFNAFMLDAMAAQQRDIRQKAAIAAGEHPGRALAGIKKPKSILAVPRYTFEKGGRGQGRGLFGTGDYNVALRSSKGVTEWNRLFKLSIQRIDHLRYDESLPTGSRLVLVSQLYPAAGPPSGGTPSVPVPGLGGETPVAGAGSEAGSLLPGVSSESKLSVPGPISGETPVVPGVARGATPLRPGPVSGSTPLLPGPVSGNQRLLPGPVSGQTPLLTGPTERTSSPSGPGSPPEGSGGPPARDAAESSTGKVVSAPRPSGQTKAATSLGESGMLSESGLASESITKAPGEDLSQQTSAPRLGLISEKGEAAAYAGALLADVMARKFADYVTGLQTGKAQDAVSKLIPQILSKLENRPDVGVIITVAYSQQTPDVSGVDVEVPRTFLWASFDLVPGLTLSEAQSHFDNVYPEPAEGELRDYRYEWFPPASSTESPQNWHSVQWNQSKPWYIRLHEWLQGY